MSLLKSKVGCLLCFMFVWYLHYSMRYTYEAGQGIVFNGFDFNKFFVDLGETYRYYLEHIHLARELVSYIIKIGTDVSTKFLQMSGKILDTLQWCYDYITQNPIVESVISSFGVLDKWVNDAFTSIFGSGRV